MHPFQRQQRRVLIFAFDLTKLVHICSLVGKICHGPDLFAANQLGDLLAGSQANFWVIMFLYVLLMLFLGTLLDTASIILIVVPLFLPLVEPMGLSLVWFGIVTVVGAEIGLLTPPLGISCFVIKSTLDDERISLKDVFMGALPFAGVMLVVLVFLIAFPSLSLVLL